MGFVAVTCRIRHRRASAPSIAPRAATLIRLTRRCRSADHHHVAQVLAVGSVVDATELWSPLCDWTEIASPKQRQALLLHTHIEHADDVAFGVLQRLIRGDVPGVDHEGPAAVGLAGEDGLDDRVLGTVRHDCRDEGADRALAVGCSDGGGHAQHVSRRVDALEEGDGFAGLLGDFVNDRDGMIEAAVGSQGRALQRPLRSSDRSAGLGELIQAFQVVVFPVIWMPPACLRAASPKLRLVSTAFWTKSCESLQML